MDELCTVCPLFNADFCKVDPPEETFFWVDSDGSIVADFNEDLITYE